MNSPSALESLVKHGINDILQSIIQQAAINPSHSIDEFGTTLLHLAAKYNNSGLLEASLKSGECNIDARDSTGVTPLLVAVAHRSFDAIKILVDAEANVFAADAAGVTVLDLLSSDKGSMPQDLLEHCLQAMKRSSDLDTLVNAFVKSECSLETVMSLRDARVTEALLEATTVEWSRSPSAIKFAMDSRDLENLRVLLHHEPESGIRRLFFFWTLFSKQVESDFDSTYFETFVRAAIEWNLIDVDMLYHLHKIFYKGNKKAIQVLLNAEMDAYVNKKFGVHLIPGLFGNRSIDAVELMGNRNFNVNIRRCSGYSALHFAVSSQMERNVEFLLDLGADPNVRDSAGQTPLLYNHAWSDSGKVAQLLLERGADIEAVDGRNISVCNFVNSKQVHALIVPHLAILKKQNAATLSPHLERLLSLSEFVGTYELCRQQLELLCKYGLSESVALIDVMVKKPERIAASILSDKDLTGAVDRFCSERQINAYYSWSLREKLKRVSVMYRARFNMASIISAHVGCTVSYGHLVIEHIFSFLTYRDACSLMCNMFNDF